MRAAWCAALAIAPIAAWAQAPRDTHVGPLVETFVDNGQLFVRAGTDRGLAVGAVLPVAGGASIGPTNEHRDVGTATVREVWASVARIELDDAAKAVSGKKYVRVPETPPPTPSTRSDAPPPAPGAVPLDGPAPPPPDTGFPVHVSMGVQRLTIYNDGDKPLTKCELRLPDNRHYRLSSPLGPKDSEGIMLFRFSQDGVPLDRPLDYVQVRCAEGGRTVRL